MKNKRNPITFLEDSFSSIKEFLDLDQNEKSMFFTTSYIQKLKEETTEIAQLCQALNNDTAFVQKINALANPNNSKGLLYKVEHFFISDIITLYNQKGAIETEKAQFTLAYFYDALRNNHFADEKAINTLNKLVSSQEFKNHLQKIRNENLILSLNPNQNFCFLPKVLSESKPLKQQELTERLQVFLQLSFDAKPNDATANEFIKQTQNEEQNSNVSYVANDDSLEKVLEELHQLIGLEEVKSDVKELINLLEIQKKRSEQGLKNIEITLHTVFFGPPGTGKTSVARLLSRIFKHLGFLSKGQMYETDREGMVAGYVGQTATKVDKAVDESKGGILFIDEAYALTQNALGNDYGAEAVNTLLKRMEDHRDDLAVVVAGYTEPMKVFIESNPGLRSRFNRFFHFDHFSPTQLYQIFENFCKNSDFIVNEDAKEKLNDTFELLYSKKDESFGNARVVRNLFEKCVQNQANRIIKLKKMNQKVLKTFMEEDIPEPKETQEQVYFARSSQKQE